MPACPRGAGVKRFGDSSTQPLYFLITMAGSDTNSICYEAHQKAEDILEGCKIDGVVATIMSLDRAIRCGSGPATESVYDRI